jgi:hypothetical protein
VQRCPHTEVTTIGRRLEPPKQPTTAAGLSPRGVTLLLLLPL